MQERMVFEEKRIELHKKRMQLEYEERRGQM